MVTFKTCKYGLVALLLIIPYYIGEAQTTNRVSQTPVFTLNTNLLYDATTSMNLGLEVKTGKRVTFKLPVTYNPWDWKDNKKFKFVLAQPELRWWFCEPFYGSFLGIHAHGAFFNVGGVGPNWITTDGLPMKNFRYQGSLFGAGLSYGHQFYLAPRWNLELSVGAGYVFLNYDRYECKTCGALLEEKKKEGHLWPTQAGITLVYILK